MIIKKTNSDFGLKAPTGAQQVFEHAAQPKRWIPFSKLNLTMQKLRPYSHCLYTDRMNEYFDSPPLCAAELSLLRAASRGDAMAALAAIALGANPDARGDDHLSSTAFMIAAKMGRLGVLEALFPHCDAWLPGR